MKTLNEHSYCRCQHCEGGIQFDGNDLHEREIRKIVCPHCRMETLIFLSPPSSYNDPSFVNRAAQHMGVNVDDKAVELIVRSSLKTPTDMIRRLKFVADFADTGRAVITAEVAKVALHALAQKEEAAAKEAFVKEAKAREDASVHERNARVLAIFGLDPQTTPSKFQDFLGQNRIKAKIQLVKSSKADSRPLGHALFVGPSGSGKTTLALLSAECIAQATNTKVKAVNGAGIKYAGDLAGFLTNLEENDLLFVDNIDVLPRAISECLEPALADFKLDIIIDEGPDARSVRLNLPHFTLIETATNKKRLSPMLQACFATDEELDDYSTAELADIVRFFANRLTLEIDDAATDLVARSAGGTPKNVLNLMRHIRVFAKIKKSSQRITAEIAAEALKLLPENENIAGLNNGRQAIPSAVRREVWRRDGGNCVKCGSRENLEYDHIIPIAKGGSNTARNIELLCEACNRTKSDSIQ